MLFSPEKNTNLTEIRQYITVSMAGDFDSLKPHIAAAELLYIKDLLGKSLYDRLTAHYSGSSSGSGSASGSGGVSASEDLDELLPYVQRPLILFAYHLGADELGVNISDQGIQIVSTDTHKQAFQWQVKGVKDSWINKAYIFTEELLEFLDENKTNYPEWASSQACTESKEFFILSAEQFNEYVWIGKSRRLYTLLKPIMRFVERRYIKATICQELYDKIKEEIRQGTTGDDNSKLLEWIRPAVAYHTMARAIKQLSIEVLPEGVLQTIIQGETLEEKKPAAGTEKAVAANTLIVDADSEIRSLQKYLDANASESKYKSYYESDCYQVPVSGQNRGEFQNDADKSFLLM